MARVRRPRYLCFFFDDFPFLDVGLLLRGAIEPLTVQQICALSILRGETVQLSADEFELVVSTPSDDWVAAVDEETTRQLARKGVLLSDEADPELDALRAPREPREGELESRSRALLLSAARDRLRRLAGQDETSDCCPDGRGRGRSWIGSGCRRTHSTRCRRRTKSARSRSSSGTGSLRRAPAP